MNRITLITSLAGLVAFTGLGTVAAQEEGGPSFSAAEIYGCSYRDRQDADDLNGAVDDWNEWMDSNDAGPYFAWTLTPHYAANNPDVDFIWLGVAPDIEGLGAYSDLRRAAGSAAEGGFAEVADCPVHLGSVVYNIKPGSGGSSAIPVLSIANCSVAKGRTVDDVMAAGQLWASYETKFGLKSATWLWFPAFGHGETDFDFRLVKGYNGGHTQLGKETAQYYDNQAWVAARRTFAGLVSCDVPRVYNGTLRRNMASE